MKRYSTILKNDQIDSVAIGGFDGIHIAHQKLISHLTKNGALIVIDKDSATLTPNGHRCKYLDLECIFLDFNEIKELNAKEFIAYLLKNFKNLKKIVVGYDFRFGKNAHADSRDLRELFDGEVVVVNEVFYDGISVHSRVIRSLLEEGKVKKATTLLGREYEIVGRHIKGQGLGSKELFATINLLVEKFLIPKEGVYATFTELDGKRYPSATFIGKRVCTDQKFSIETHILDVDIKEDDIDREIVIYFVDYIRENMKFDTLDLLKNQISKDLSVIRELLS